MKQEKREKLHLVLIQMRYSKMASLLPNFVRSTRLKQKPQSTMWLTPLALGIAEALSKTRKTSITFCLSLHPRKRLMPLLCFSNLITTGCQPLLSFVWKSFWHSFTSLWWITSSLHLLTAEQLSSDQETPYLSSKTLLRRKRST